MTLIEKVRPYTTLSEERLMTISCLANQTNETKLEGDFVECGVMNGGSAAILAHYAKELKRKTWLFDSFEGLPSITKEDTPSLWGSYRQHRPFEEIKCFDGHDNCKNDSHFYDVPVEHSPEIEVGKCEGSLNKVQEVLNLVDVGSNSVVIVQGWFKNSFPLVNIPKIAMLCLDSDWYESEKLCINKFYDNVVSGGFIYFDDYYFWPGCKKAIDEFFENRGERPAFIKVHHSAWMQKGK